MAEFDAADLHTFIEKQRIQELLLRSARGDDRLDRDLIASLFHPEGTCEFGALLLEGADTIADAIVKAAGGCLLTYHLLGMPLIELRGDVAAGETYFLATSSIAGENEGDKILRMRSGRYLDRIEKRDGTWRISVRTVIEDWSKSFEVPAGSANPAFRPGQQGQQDFLYTLLSELPQ